MGGVRYERDGRVAVITHHRPEAIDAISGEMRPGLNAAFTRGAGAAGADPATAGTTLAAARERRAPRWQGR